MSSYVACTVYVGAPETTTARTDTLNGEMRVSITTGVESAALVTEK
jgi:hypothetical protein